MRFSSSTPAVLTIQPSSAKLPDSTANHRAGGVMGILGELDRAGLLNRNVNNILGLSLPETLSRYDVMLTQDAHRF